MTECIALASGKGGVGKTLLTAALGLALAEEGYRVLLADCDMGLRNLDIPLGMEDKLRWTVWDLAQGKCLEKEAVLPVRENLDLLTASGEEEWKEISRHVLFTVFEDMQGKYDYILLDCPAGAGKGIRFAESAADRFLMIVSPSRASLRDAETMARLLQEKGRPFAVILNRCGGGPVTADAMREALKTFPLAGAVPYSAEADRLAQQGKLAECGKDSAFREAAALLAKVLTRGAEYPVSRWKKLEEQAALEEPLPARETAARPVSALLRQRRETALRWRRR